MRRLNTNINQAGYLRRHKRFILAERVLTLLGLLLLAIYGCAQLYTFALSRAAIYTFDHAYLAASQKQISGPATLLTGSDPDFKLWSNARVRAYRALSTLSLNPAIAVLSIPRLRLIAPVFEGTEAAALDRGLGRITGTAALGASGNVAIAGHRDGFFRVLQDVHSGDLIQVRALGVTDIYTVKNTRIVSPRDVSVLGPSAFSTLTLVTCYPFYFVGDAPKRFIVRAVLKQRTLGPGAIVPASQTTLKSNVETERRASSSVP